MKSEKRKRFWGLYEEINKRAKDKSLSGQEKRRYQKEQKYRDLRNVSKRKEKYRSKVEVLEPNISVVKIALSTGGVLIIDTTLEVAISVGAGMIIRAFH